MQLHMAVLATDPAALLAQDCKCAFLHGRLPLGGGGLDADWRRDDWYTKMFVEIDILTCKMPQSGASGGAAPRRGAQW